MTAVADGAECKVAIEFKGRVMDMREQGSCTSFRGLSCYFGRGSPVSKLVAASPTVLADVIEPSFIPSGPSTSFTLARLNA